MVDEIEAALHAHMHTDSRSIIHVDGHFSARRPRLGHLVAALEMSKGVGVQVGRVEHQSEQHELVLHGYVRNPDELALIVLE